MSTVCNKYEVETIFSSLHFLQKTNKRILLYYYETSGRLDFVRFLEEIEDTKKTFRNYLTFTTVLESFFPAKSCVDLRNSIIYKQKKWEDLPVDILADNASK